MPSAALHTNSHYYFVFILINVEIGNSNDFGVPYYSIIVPELQSILHAAEMDILIIDDDPDDTSLFCEVVKEIMPSARCVIENNFSNIELTFRHFTELPRLVFIDGLMFPVSGKDCLMLVKDKLKGNTNTRTIIYSGYVGPEQVAEFKKLGADDVKIKANNYDSLKAYLSGLLKECDTASGAA